MHVGPLQTYVQIHAASSEKPLGDNRFRVTGRLDGNFPGGTANLNFDFTVVGDLISHLKIAP
jgi:hypothetical protein